jgi:hypothetical protein
VQKGKRLSVGVWAKPTPPQIANFIPAVAFFNTL